MKKYYFMAASAALVLSSCSNEIDQVSNLENSGKKEIKVSTYTPGMTRTADTGATDEELAEYGFTLQATYPVEIEGKQEDETLVYAHFAQLDGEAWAPATYDAEQGGFVANDAVEMFWPENLNTEVSFYAMYNETMDDVEISEGKTNVNLSQYTYDYDTLCRPQVDYMAAKTMTSYSKSNEGSVELDFNHILAKVTTQIKAEVTDYYAGINVHEVKIKMPNGGTYDFNDGTFDFSTGVTEDIVLYKGGISVYAEYGDLGDDTYAYVMPAENAELSVTFVYLDQAYNAIGNEITKTAFISLTAGVYNQYQIYVPTPERKELVITTKVTSWETSDPVEKTLE